MRRLPVGLVVVALAAYAAPAAADKAEKADALFKKGKKQLADHRYNEACATFEQVDKLDPGIGAKLNVAKCYEEWGRLAIAYHWYVDAQAMAVATKDDRAPKIKALAAELDGNVPRVTLKIPPGADPVVLATLTFDGKPVPDSWLDTEQRVDPGAHVVEFVVGGVKKKKMAPVERGGSSEISLDMPKGDGRVGRNTRKPKSGPKTSPTEPTGDELDAGELAARPGHGRRVAGVVVASTGVAALGVATYLTLSARSSYKGALADHCMGSTSMCDAPGLTLTHDARHRANVATLVSIAGGAAVIGGVVLYLTAPHGKRADEHALYLTPVVGADGGAVVFGGRY